MKHTLLVKRLPNSQDLPLPSYATASSAGMDLYAANLEAITIKPGQTALVPTGISIALPSGFEAQIRPRSGLALKNSITVLNTPGTIDADYRGEICVILINHSSADFLVERGMRVAQMVIAAVSQMTIQQADELDQTERGTGGFGSTGVKEALGA